MKSTLRKLAVHYGVQYSSLVNLVKELPEDVIKSYGKGRVEILNVTYFESVISSLPKVESFGTEIQVYTPDDGTVIDAEIVSEDIDTGISQMGVAHLANQKALEDAVKLAAKQRGLQLANAYRSTLAEVFSEGRTKADRDILGFLGK